MNKNLCDRIKILILDGKELSTDDRQTVLNHIANCPECKAEYNFYENLDSITSIEVPVPTSLHSSIMSAVHEEQQFKSQEKVLTPKKKLHLRKWGYACAAVFACVMTVTIVLHSGLLTEKSSPIKAGFFDDQRNLATNKDDVTDNIQIWSVNYNNSTVCSLVLDDSGYYYVNGVIAGRYYLNSNSSIITLEQESGHITQFTISDTNPFVLEFLSGDLFWES